MQKKILNATLSVACLAAMLAGQPARAIEAGGVRFDDKLALGGRELLANGAGVRRKFVFDVYAIALYLPARASTAEAVLAQPAPRRIAIRLLRDVAAGDFVDALRKGLRDNLAPAEMTALGPQIEQFAQTLLAAGEVKKGSAVDLDHLPGSGTRVTLGGQVRGRDIAGDAFFNGLLAVWLGGKPVQDDLKNRLLGR